MIDFDIENITLKILNKDGKLNINESTEKKNTNKEEIISKWDETKKDLESSDVKKILTLFKSLSKANKKAVMSQLKLI